MKQRSTRAERMAAKEVLRGLWEKAFSEGIVSIDFREEGGELESAKKAGTKLHQALGDFRKEIRKKATLQADLMIKINAVMLLKESEGAVIKLQKKAGNYSERTSIILDAATRVEGLMNQGNHADAIGGIVGDFLSK